MTSHVTVVLPKVLLHLDFLRKEKEGVLGKFQQMIYGKSKPLFWVPFSLWKFWNGTNSRTKLNLSGKSPVSALHCRIFLRWGINELEKPNPFVIRILKPFISMWYEERGGDPFRESPGEMKNQIVFRFISADILEDCFLSSHLAGGREAGTTSWAMQNGMEPTKIACCWAEHIGFPSSLERVSWKPT